jgi:DNA modification methylase
VQSCVTSPPYFGLRDYGVEGQIGLEDSLEDWIEQLVTVFREVRRVLVPTGSLWLNLGDSYSGGGRGGNPGTSPHQKQSRNQGSLSVRNQKRSPLKDKDLIGQPWRVAFALQADGWWLRSEIIWHKPTAMPESCKDRPTKAHETVFLLTKAPRYYYDGDAIAEPRASLGGSSVNGWASGDTPHNAIAHSKDKGDRKTFRGQGKYANNASFSPIGKPNAQKGNRDVEDETRNARSVWSIVSEPFPEAHFATFPTELARRCILAGCPVNGTVLDPFLGSGTTALVAARLQRHCIGIELNSDYAEMARRRVVGDAPLFAEVAVA